MDIRDLTQNKETITDVSITDDKKNVTTRYRDVVVNHAPVVEDFDLTLNWNQTINISQAQIESHATDVEGDLLAFVKILQLPEVGLISLNNNPVILNQVIAISQLTDLNYTPSKNGFGLNYANVKLAVNDDGLPPNPYSSAFTISFNVLSITAPNISDKAIAVIENESHQFSSNDFTSNYQDDDNGNPNQLKIKTLPTQGSLLYNGVLVEQDTVINLSDLDTNDLIYTPISDQSGRPYTNFTFQINDDINPELFSNVHSIEMIVNAIPTMQLGQVSTAIDQEYAFDVEYLRSLFTDVDEDNPKTITFTSLSTNGTLKHGSTVITDGYSLDIGSLNIQLLTYTPNPTFGLSSGDFYYTISDDYVYAPATSAIAQMIIEVTPSE